MRRDQSFGNWLATLVIQIVFLMALVVLLVSCQSAETPYTAFVPTEDTDPLRQVHSDLSPTGVRSIELSVLTFNVAGLPWPVSSGRAAATVEISHQITALSESGNPIDIVLIQEGFVKETSQIPRDLGFRYWASGPGPDLKSGPSGKDGATPSIRRKWWKGEGLRPWVGSGLHIFSAHPIIGVKRMAFGREACAGYDCLANKGAVAAQIYIPGLPVPLDVITAHLNSTHAAGVPVAETHHAHQQQVARLADFWRHATDRDHPVIMAGDLNIRDSHERFVPLARTFRDAGFVKSDCQEFGGPTVCDIEVRTDAPWLSSQDVHAYRHGQSVLIQPLEATTVFHEPVNGTLLSDHFGYLVRYRLSWKTMETPAALSAAN